MQGMPTTADARFLTYISDLTLCSRCLRNGRRTPIRQVISPRHRLLTLCRGCREQNDEAAARALRRAPVPS